MSRRIHPAQMEAWVKKLQKRMSKFLSKSGSATPEQKLEFIQHQYALLDIIVKALDGKVYIVGCSQPSHHDDET